eukprot:COSAG04_NODE_2352_length_4286_cov_6.280153_9_plen_78_part_00
MGGEDPVDGLKELAPFVTTVVMKDCALTEPEAIDEYGASLISFFPHPLAQPLTASSWWRREWRRGRADRARHGDGGF